MSLAEKKLWKFFLTNDINEISKNKNSKFFFNSNSEESKLWPW